MIISNIYGEVGRHEIWKCECKEGIFYLDTFPTYRVVHWNYPEITPTDELLQKAKIAIERKKQFNKRKEKDEYELER